MNPRPAPSRQSGFTGHGQSGNSGGKRRGLDPGPSNADIRFTTVPFAGQE